MRRLLLPLVLVIAVLLAWWVIRRPTTPDAPSGPGRRAEVREAPVRLEGASPRPAAPPEDEEELDAGPGSGPGLAREFVSVLVLDAEDETPIAGAVVHVHEELEQDDSHTATSGVDGRVRLPRERGPALWTVRCAGYVFLQREVARGKEPALLRLDPAPALAGRVVDAVTGRGLLGARVLSVWADPPSSRADVEHLTDAEGRFVIAGVPPGRLVDLVVARVGFATVRVRSEGTDALEIRLGDGADVQGQVVDATGSAVPGAEVFVVDDGQDSPLLESLFGVGVEAMWPSRAVADAGGRFLVQGVAAPAMVIVYARGPDGAAGRSERVSLEGADAQAEVEVTVGPLGHVEVRFLDARTGEVVSPWEIRCSIDADWSHASEHQRSRDKSAKGVTRFREVTSGTHHVHALARRHLSPSPAPIEVVAGASVRIDIELEQGLTVTGRIVDDAGTPLEAYVMFDATWRGVRQHPNTRSDESGHFTLVGVPPTSGELLVFDHQAGRRGWPAIEISGDVGDLVLPRPPRLVGRLPPGLLDTPILGGHWSRTHRSEAGEVGSEEEGIIEIDDLPPGEPITVFLRPEGGAALLLHDVVLAPGEVRDLGLLTFPDPIEISGRILDAAGSPVSGALVRTVEWWCDEQTRTDAEGRFRLPLLPPGRSTLWIETAPSTVAFRTVDAATGMAPLELTLAAPGRLRCRLVGEDRMGVPNAPVNVARRTDAGEADWTRRTIPRTDSRGWLELDLYPGGYALTPHSATGLTMIGEPLKIVVTSGAVLEVEIRARPAR